MTAEPYGSQGSYRAPTRYQPPEPSLADDTYGSPGSYRAAESYRAPEQSSVPDPYGTPGSYRAPDPYRPSEPDQPSGSYRVPGYYRQPDSSPADQPYQAPETQQAAEAYPVTESGSYSGDSYTGDDSYTGHDEPEPYEPEPYEAPADFEPAEPYEPLSSYDAPEPEPYDAPEEPTGSAADEYGALGRYGESTGEPDQGRKGPTGEEDYADFWREERRGGGLHSSRSSQPKDPVIGYGPGPKSTAPPGPPSLPGDVPASQPSSVRRQAGFLVAVLCIIIAAGATAAVFLLSHHGKKQPAAGGSPSSAATTHHPTTSPPATSAGPPPPPALTGAGGHLGVPRAIGSLQLNPSLTGKFVGSTQKKQDANSFYIPDKDVVSGFYTASSSATSFSAKQPRVMFMAAYLAGSLNVRNALHSFMTDTTFTHQQQVSPGALGGVAACGELPQKGGPVAHCMWADGNTYAYFYAWGSSPSALAQTMIGIRPQVELKH